MAKTTPWTKIKAEYLQGVTPKELALKYGLTAEQISQKAKRDKWKPAKDIIKQKTTENVQDKIAQYSNRALEVLNEVINDPESENRDKVSAARAILDVSGLKRLTQEIKTDVIAEVNSTVKHEVSEKKIEKVLKKLDGLADE